MSIQGTDYINYSLGRRQFNSFVPVIRGTDVFWAQRQYLEGSLSVGTIEVGAVELKDDVTGDRARIITGNEITGTTKSLAVAVSAGTISGIGTMDNINTIGTIAHINSIGTIGQKLSETLAGTTDGADGTYYYYTDMEDYRHFASQLVLDGGSGVVTVTCETTVQDDGTPQGSCTYQDVTRDWFAEDSFTSTVLLERDTPVAVKYVRYKVASVTGDNSGDWTIYHKKMF